uniref:C-type lectin domain-containing protein n=1 Tax=Scleropages formosus TaxID=113540 RepID=A0A8C9UZS4_SCLFO
RCVFKEYFQALIEGGPQNCKTLKTLPKLQLLTFIRRFFRPSLERVCKKCQQSWIFFQSKCYFFSNESRSWRDSQSHCQSAGAELLIDWCTRGAR